MDQARHWTWAKRKHGLMIGSSTTNDHNHHDLGHPFPVKASYDHDSWEEQAFAEDSSGPLGGCIWPPRSYSCSFCRREFRSAQALGGHMNVHRRDRARLKQSQPSDLAPYPNNPLIMMSGGDGTSIISTPQVPKFPSQVCVSVYNPNPNSDPNNLVAPFISPPQVVPQKDHHFPKHDQDSSLSSSSFHLLQENNHSKWSKDNSHAILNNPSPWSNLTSTDKTTCPLNKASQRLDLHGVSSVTVESGGTCRPNNRDYHHHHHVKTSDLSVSLNLVVCRSCPITTTLNQEDIDHHHHHHHESVISSCKRRKTTNKEDMIIKEQAYDINSDNVNSRVDQVSPNCSIEELDLELRLGNGPYLI